MTTTFKRGDTFIQQGQVLINGVVTDLTNWSVRSQIRADDPTRTLIQALTATVVDGPNATIKLYASNTQTKTWTLGRAFLDIELTAPDGVVTSTPPLVLTIAEGVTHD